MAPDEKDLWALRELADEVPKLLSLLSEKLWQSGEVPINWKRGNITSTFRREKRKIKGTTGQPVSPL